MMQLGTGTGLPGGEARMAKVARGSTPASLEVEAPSRSGERLLRLAAERYTHLLFRRMEEAEYAPEAELPDQSEEELTEALDLARGAPESGLARLRERCGLSPLDEEILLLCAAVEMDARMRQVLGQWPQIPGYRPTLRLLLELWGPERGAAAVRERCSRTAPLLRHGLLAFASHEDWDDSSSPAESELQISDRVLRWLLGEEGLDPYLSLYVTLLEPSVTFADLCMPRTVPEGLERLLEEQDPDSWWAGTLPAGPPLILAVGLAGAGRFALSEAVAHKLGLRVLQVDLQALGAETSDYGHYVARLLREATLQRALPVFVDCARFLPGEDFDATAFWVLSRKLASHPGPVVFCLDKPLPFERFPASHRVLRVDLEVPPAPYRRDLWLRALPAEGTAEDVDTWALAKIFNFGGGGIRELLREAINRVLLEQGPAGKLRMEDLMNAGRELQSRRMGKMTRRMIPKTGLDDIVLPPRVRAALQEIIHTVRYRHIVLQDWGFGEKISSGKGLSALFSGPPGTGKSMAAGVVSRECGMNLFRVNLAMVVSKYVGETEERLSKVFEQARESHSILLFDEADALFAKRSKVKSAQDKYANLEVNFLLQEVESFEGIVVLTTNLEAMIDKAFLRRLNFRVFFPKPEADARLEIWQHLRPAKAPFSPDVDWRALAEDFDITGGYIKNAILRAAQRAAERDGVITHELLCQAAEAEMAETGRVVREVYQ